MVLSVILALTLACHSDIVYCLNWKVVSGAHFLLSGAKKISAMRTEYFFSLLFISQCRMSVYIFHDRDSPLPTTLNNDVGHLSVYSGFVFFCILEIWLKWSYN